MTATRRVPDGVRTLYRCRCGWHRDIGHASKDRWDLAAIQHPLYGTITNIKAAIEDVLRHRCQFILSRERKIEELGRTMSSYDV